MARVDYMEKEDGDLLFENGDLVIGESDENHIYDVIKSVKGEWREFPLLGLNAVRFKNSTTSRTAFVHALKEELRKDGYPNVRVEFNGDGLSDFTLIVG